jgi:hypothetical protein
VEGPASDGAARPPVLPATPPPEPLLDGIGWPMLSIRERPVAEGRFVVRSGAPFGVSAVSWGKEVDEKGECDDGAAADLGRLVAGAEEVERSSPSAEGERGRTVPRCMYQSGPPPEIGTDMNGCFE